MGMGMGMDGRMRKRREWGKRGSVKKEDEKKEKRGNGRTLYVRSLPN